jgi:hypothetical protein
MGGLFMAFFYPHFCKSVGKHPPDHPYRGMKELAHMPILVLAAQLCPPGIEARLVIS